MEPITIIFGGSTVTVLGILGRIVYNYGRDRKELNGTVDRVKRIETRLDEHIEHEEHDFRDIRQNVAEIKTKVDLLVEDKIKHG